ncbi:zinc finger protein 721-like [Littorina saxatilis]|uniref:zinc finger protein 721-like n=1 Tax=Littorina saxatilis TaxID=31220 RepID=UPI0038B67D21
MEFYVDTAWKRGRRIVDVFHLANQMDCTQCKGLLDLRRTRRETRVGLASVLDILCSCGNVNRIHTDRRVKNEDEIDDYLVNTLILSSKSNYMLKIAQADLQSFLDIFCIPVTLPFNAVTDSSTPSPAAASVTPSDISDRQTVTATPGDTQSGVFSSNPRHLHSDDKQMSPSERMENVVESSEHEMSERGESLVSVNTESSRELTLTSQSETSNDFPEEYLQLLKPELLHLEENNSFRRGSQLATELCENAEGVKLKVDQHGECPVKNLPTLAFKSSVPLVGNERDSHPAIKSEDTHCNGDVTKSVSDMMTSDSDRDEHISVSISDVPVAVGACEKMVPAQPVVRKKYNERNKSGSKLNYLTKRYAQDVPLEDMIGTCPVAEAIDEPGGSQSDGSKKRFDFECRVCDELFTSELEAYCHVSRHTGSHYLRCFRCGMEFKGKDRTSNTNNLEVHLNKHDDVRPYVCEVCAKTYQSFRQHKQHMSYVHNYVRGAPAPQDSSLSCQECSFRATSHAKLTIHHWNHKKQRDRTCNICGAILSTQASLKHHKRRRHAKGADDEYTFACELCEKRFQVRKNLMKHLRVHSKEDGAMQSGDSSGDPSHHSNHQHMSLSERAENLVDSSEHEAEGRGESITNAQNSHRLTLTSQTETSNDLPEEYFQGLKPKLLYLVENDCFGQDSQHATECSENAQVVTVPQHVESPVKREDDHRNGDMTTFFSDVMTSDSVRDVHVPVSIIDVSVAVSDSGKMVPAQSVVGKKLKRIDKPGSKLKYLSIRDAQDVPLEEMIQTFPVAAASDEPGGSQSDGSQKRFECRVCDELFTSELEAYCHVSRHTGSPYLRCFRCGMEFKGKIRMNNTNNLEVHLNKHDDVRPYVCELCAKTYQSSRQHYQHMSFMHNYVGGAPAPQDSSLSCQQCSFRATSRTKLTIHRRKHIQQLKRTCNICGAILSTPASLKHHKKRRHAEGANEYNEDMQSGDSSSDPRHHSNHQQMSLSERGENLVENSENEAAERGESIVNAQNSECFRKHFAQDVPLEEMIQTCPVAAASDEPGGSQRDISEKQFRCRECGRRFTSELEAYCHVRCHTGSPYLRCFRCGMDFKGKWHRGNIHNLEAHLNRHDNLRPYICEVCAKTFQSSRQLKQHMTEVHNYVGGAPPSQDSSFSCQQCSFKTHSKARLRIHSRIHTTQRERICDVCGAILSSPVSLKHHKERLHETSADDYSFACELCEKRFRIRSSLLSHLRWHKKGDVRAYQCQFCPKAFKKTTHLNIHERIHTGKKPHKCQLCEAAFVQKSSLDWHMKKHWAIK